MFQKIVKRLSRERKPVEPHQSKRLQHEKNTSGNEVFVIRGKGRPGFFILFGSIFLIPSAGTILGLLFGTTNPDNPGWVIPATILFLIPFFLIGATTLMTGIFLWLGRTQLTLSSSTILLERSLFGKVFRSKQLNREGLKIQFKESHKDNDQARYKLELQSGTESFSIGGSLKEAELLWLNRELRASLGEIQTNEPANIASAIQSELEEDVTNTKLDPDFQSKRLRFAHTLHGWEARFKYGFSSSLFLTIFGSVFFGVGLIMEGSLLAYLGEQFAWIGDLAKQSTGDPPPLWFALIFGGVGAVVMLLGISMVGYRMILSKRHSRIHLSKRWFGVGTDHIFEVGKIQRLEVTNNGSVNDEPRFKLTLHLTGEKKHTLLRFAEGSEAGQLKARLEHEKKQVI